MQHHVVDKRYPLQPHHIDTTRDQWEGFKNQATSYSALWLVMFFQQEREGRWRPFTLKEINCFYVSDIRNNLFTFSLFGLAEILKEEKEVWYITHEFIARCFRASPKIPAELRLC